MLVPLPDEELKQIQARAAVNLLVTIIYEHWNHELDTGCHWPAINSNVIDKDLMHPLRRTSYEHFSGTPFGGSQVLLDDRHMRYLYEAVGREVSTLPHSLYPGIAKLASTAKRCNTSPLAAMVLETRAIIFAHGPYGDDRLREILRESCHRLTLQFGQKLAQTCATARDFDRLLTTLLYLTDARSIEIFRGELGRTGRLTHSPAVRSALMAFLDNVDLVIDVPTGKPATR